MIERYKTMGKKEIVDFVAAWCDKCPLYDGCKSKLRECCEVKAEWLREKVESPELVINGEKKIIPGPRVKYYCPWCGNYMEKWQNICHSCGMEQNWEEVE